jgi:hypothetical protein
MSLKVPNVGLLSLLDAETATWGAAVSLRLFKNNLTPTSTTVLGDLTVADFPGYANVNVASWAAAAIVSGRAKSIGALCTFTLSSTGGPHPVYGYYVVFGGNLLWVERDPNAPVNLATAGDSYSVIPVFTRASEF